jgi:hypothetical protein
MLRRLGNLLVRGEIHGRYESGTAAALQQLEAAAKKSIYLLLCPQSDQTRLCGLKYVFDPESLFHFGRKQLQSLSQCLTVKGFAIHELDVCRLLQQMSEIHSIEEIVRLYMSMSMPSEKVADRL